VGSAAIGIWFGSVHNLEYDSVLVLLYKVTANSMYAHTNSKSVTAISFCPLCYYASNIMPGSISYKEREIFIESQEETRTMQLWQTARKGVTPIKVGCLKK
jgi:hypothetical protein